MTGLDHTCESSWAKFPPRSTKHRCRLRLSP